MPHGGKRVGAGRPRLDSARRSIPADMLEIVDAMLYQRREHGIHKFKVAYENASGFQVELNTTAYVTEEAKSDGKVRIYIDHEMRPMIERTARAVAVFAGDVGDVKTAFASMKKGMDLETFGFLAEVNGLTKES